MVPRAYQKILAGYAPDNFHHKFRFIFSLILSENAPNVHSREAKFQNFPGEHAPGPP